MAVAAIPVVEDNVRGVVTVAVIPVVVVVVVDVVVVDVVVDSLIFAYVSIMLRIKLSIESLASNIGPVVIYQTNIP